MVIVLSHFSPLNIIMNKSRSTITCIKTLLIPKKIEQFCNCKQIFKSCQTDRYQTLCTSILQPIELPPSILPPFDFTNVGSMMEGTMCGSMLRIQCWINVEDIMLDQY